MSASVSVAKPAALPLAESAQVSVTRTMADFRKECTGTARRGSASLYVFSRTLLYEAGIEMLELIYRQTQLPSTTHTTGTAQDKHRAAIALGSNLGDRFWNIESALCMLESSPDENDDSSAPAVTILDTSFMYETSPMYVTDQPMFLNCACLVRLYHLRCRGFGFF